MMFTYCPSCGHKETVIKQDNTNYECGNCHWHFWNNAKAATALVFLRGDHLLFSQRGEAPNKGRYDLPGGFVDVGENAYDAAIREAREELGVTVNRQDLELIEAYHNNYNDSISTVDLVFLIRAWTGELTASDDVAALAWKPLSFIYDPLFCQAFYAGLDKIIAAKK